MRSAVIGCLVCEDPALRKCFTNRSSQLTHSDPKAAWGAMAISELAARLASGEWLERPSVEEVRELLLEISEDPEWGDLVLELSHCLSGAVSLTEFAHQLSGKGGISGYVHHTVLFAIACWFLYFGDFEKTIQNCILAGGDTDTTAAICGALVGITCWPGEIPARWSERITLWPLKRSDFSGAPEQRTLFPFLVQSWIRNLLFFLVVLVHLGRRLFPPY